MKKYILTESELRLLLQDQKCLEALKAYGVDNWESCKLPHPLKVWGFGGIMKKL